VKFRVIPTVLTDGQSQVKGEGFVNWRTVGSVIQAVKVHSTRDVDELVLLDVRASAENRLLSKFIVNQVAQFLRVPLTVGGGIKSVADAGELLFAGADKVVIGTAAVTQPGLIAELASVFGSQAVVCSVDAQGNSGPALIACGTKQQGLAPQHLATYFQEQGAGEILLQDIERDGRQQGMNLELFRSVIQSVSIPVIGSSGAGGAQDFYEAFQTGVSAVAAGALFQFTENTPSTVKSFLKGKGVVVRN
jgi:cyclase